MYIDPSYQDILPESSAAENLVLVVPVAENPEVIAGKVVEVLVGFRGRIVVVVLVGMIVDTFVGIVVGIVDYILAVVLVDTDTFAGMVDSLPVGYLAFLLFVVPSSYFDLLVVRFSVRPVVLILTLFGVSAQEVPWVVALALWGVVLVVPLRVVV